MYEWRRQWTDSSPGSPAAARQAANRSSICRGEIRPPRSVSHSAVPPRRLLAPPALQHRVEQRGLGPQRHRAVHQH